MESSTVSGSRPREKARHACASRSTTSTRRPSSTSAAASDATVVVLATPPFWLATAMVRASVTGITVAAACEAARVKDEGLFGPESLTWQVHADPILWIAGLRALLLQAVNPAATADVPSSAAEIADYFASMRAEAAVDRRARRVASYVLLPPMPKWATWSPARPAWAGAAGLAAALLPRWTRRLYGLPTPPGSDAAATAALRALHAAMRAAPDRYREGPHLRAARQRLDLIPAG